MCGMPFGTVEARDIIDRICMDVELPPGLITLSRTVLDRVSTYVSSVSRSSSICLAAAVVFFVGDDSQNVEIGSLSDMAKLANIHAKALTKVVNDLRKHKTQLMGGRFPSTFNPTASGKTTVMRL